MKTDTPTPRTDEQNFGASCATDFARQPERELAAATTNASPWMRTADKHPDKDERVLAMFVSGHTFVGYRSGDFNDGPWRDTEWLCFEDDDVPYWMRIPPLPDHKLIDGLPDRDGVKRTG